MPSLAYRRYVRSVLSEAERRDLQVVDGLASQLQAHLASSAEAIAVVHHHGAASKAVQEVVARLLTDALGFQQEIVLTPATGFVTHARPDFVLRLGPGRGVLAEVERGGAVTNNHDLKDLWKAHIAPDAQHLFLIVPESNTNAAGQSRERPFLRVANRTSAFFGDPRREIDVVSAHVFGY